MKIIAYYRVAPKKQAKSGNALNLRAQKATVVEFAQRNKGKVIASYQEVEADRKGGRPKLLKALSECKTTGATLVIAKLDRLSRDVSFTDTLLKSGVEFFACDNPHANKQTIQILAGVAENSSVAKSRNMKDALAAVKKDGKLLGSARPGHWDGREHKRGWKKGAKAAGILRSKHARETYAFVLPIIQEMRDDGQSYDNIAEALNKLGHKTCTGVDFNGSAVWRIIKRSETPVPA